MEHKLVIMKLECAHAHNSQRGRKGRRVFTALALVRSQIRLLVHPDVPSSYSFKTLLDESYTIKVLVYNMELARFGPGVFSFFLQLMLMLPCP